MSCVHHVLRRAPARLYVGTNRGVLALRPDTGESESLGLENEAVYTVAEVSGPDGEVQLWAGLDQGIACRTAAGWKRFELGLSGQPMVNALHVTRDAAGHTRLWCGLQGGGLVCLEPGCPPAHPRTPQHPDHAGAAQRCGVSPVRG
jgi:ligand-binding sensor domain-containing protein